MFLPDYGTIGSFTIPPMAPNSFFDVFIDVPLSDLPPGPPVGPGLSASQDPGCPPFLWRGNVHVFWNGDGGWGEVLYHAGFIGVCPGGAVSCTHLNTGCGNNINWMINNSCGGLTVTLKNEDYTPAPAMLPANWSGYLCVTAVANIPVGTQCDYGVDFWCNGEKATVNIRAFACACEVGTHKNSWGRVKSIYR